MSRLRCKPTESLLTIGIFGFHHTINAMCAQDDAQAEASEPSVRLTTPDHVEQTPFPWHLGVFDAHCHLAERPGSVTQLTTMKTKALAVMATRGEDQHLVAHMAKSNGIKTRDDLSPGGSCVIIASYGRHPWFSHSLYDDTVAKPTFCYQEGEDLEVAKEQHYKAILQPPPQDPAFWRDLPTPEPLSQFMAATKAHLQADSCAMVGEIGLDKPFRLAMQWEDLSLKDRDPERTTGGRQGRPLSPYHIQMDHQKTVLLAHLRLAGELDRAVSAHGVQVHGALYDLLSSCWKGHELRGRNHRSKNKGPIVFDSDIQKPKPYPPRICLHSFSGKSDAVKQYLKPSIPASIFFSFAATNNLRNDGERTKARDAIKMVPDNRILVESDLHAAGDRMDSELEEMYRFICEVKEWNLADGVTRIGSNYREFVFGQ